MLSIAADGMPGSCQRDNCRPDGDLIYVLEIAYPGENCDRSDSIPF